MTAGAWHEIVFLAGLVPISVTDGIPRKDDNTTPRRSAASELPVRLRGAINAVSRTRRENGFAAAQSVWLVCLRAPGAASRA